MDIASGQVALVEHRSEAEVVCERRPDAAHRHTPQELVDVYWDVVYRFVARMAGDADDAHDLTQEIFVKAIQSLSKLNDLNRLRPWLFRIAVNHTRNALRDRERRERIEAGAPVSGERDAFAGVDERLTLEAAMGKLPEKLRIVLLLKYIAELPYSEISRTLGVSKATVDMRLREARSRLRQELEGMDT